MSRLRPAIVVVLSSALTAGLLVASTTFGNAASGARVGWSSAYYTAWTQPSYPPSSLLWNDFTVLLHFSVKTSSARNGTIDTTAHGMSPTIMQAAVAAAHAHGRKILLSVGGAEDLNWDAACSATYRSLFVSNLVALMRQYGYDGLDLDVEQDFGAPAHTDFIACIAAIRSALNAITPRPMLTEPVDPSWQAYMVAPVAQYLDQINLMSYWGDVTKMPTEVANFTSRSVPVSKLGIGLGLDPGMVDTNLASCQAKTAYAANNGLGGVMEWSVADAAAPPCMAVVGSYLSGVTPPTPTPTPTATPTPTPKPTPTPTTTHSPTPRPTTQATPAPTTTASSAGSAQPSQHSGSVALRPSASSSPSIAATERAPASSSSGPSPLFIFLGIVLAGAVIYAVWRLR